jgi:hypothetical protein
VASEEILGQEKCTKQFVQTAVKTVKSLSNRKKADQFIAEIAILSTDHNFNVI